MMVNKLLTEMFQLEAYSRQFGLRFFKVLDKINNDDIDHNNSDSDDNNCNNNNNINKDKVNKCVYVGLS